MVLVRHLSNPLRVDALKVVRMTLARLPLCFGRGLLFLLSDGSTERFAGEGGVALEVAVHDASPVALAMTLSSRSRAAFLLRSNTK